MDHIVRFVRGLLFERLRLAAFLLIFVAARPIEGDVDITQFTIRDPRLQASQIFSDAKVVALAVAAEKGDVKQLDALLNQGVDVNTPSKQSLTPLGWALIAKNEAGFEWLLQKGADPNHFVWNQVPLIHLAAQQKSPRWLRLCLEYRGDANIVNRCEDIPDGRQTTIFCALQSASFEQKIDMLIKAGADLNHQDHAGRTPLLYASLHCNLSRVYLLLEAGADFHIPADGGRDLAFDMIWELPRLTGPSDKELRAHRDKILDFLEAHDADFGPAEADIAKNFPQIVPLWEQDKKRRAARKPAAVRTDQADRQSDADER